METTLSINHYYQRRNEAIPAPRALLELIETLPAREGILLCLSKDDDAPLFTRYLQRFGLSVGQGTSEPCDIILVDLQAEPAAADHAKALVFCGCPDSSQSYAKALRFLPANGQPATVATLLPAKDISVFNTLLKENGLDAMEMPAADENTVLTRLTERLTSKLLKDASAVEYSQYVDIGQRIASSKDAAQILAFLIRNHLSQSAPAIARPLEPRRERRDRDGDRPRDRRNGERRPAAREHRESREPREGREIKEAARERDNGDARRERPAPENPPEHRSEEQAQSLYINLGRDDGFNSVQDLIDYLSGQSKVDIGHFTMVGQVRDHSSHIEVDSEVSPQIIETFHGKPKSTGKKMLSADGHESFPAFVCEIAKGTRERRPHSRFHRPRHQSRVV